MQNVTWPAVVKIARHSLNVEAHSVGDQGRGGHYAFDVGGGARWRGTLDIPALKIADALTFRAFLHSLRGRSGTFYLTMPGLGGTTVAGTNTNVLFPGSDTVELAGSAAAAAKVGDYALVGGNWTSFDPLGPPQLVRIVALSGSTATVRPRLRQTGLLPGLDLAIGAVVGRFRLDMETPAVPIVGERSRELTLQIIEAI